MPALIGVFLTEITDVFDFACAAAAVTGVTEGAIGIGCGLTGAAAQPTVAESKSADTQTRCLKTLSVLVMRWAQHSKRARSPQVGAAQLRSTLRIDPDLPAPCTQPLRSRRS